VGLARGKGSQMALPGTVRVKLSSEDAGSITLTSVVVQDLPLRELVEVILGITGKDEPRIRAALRRGSFVAGASRFRWEGLAVEEEDLGGLLSTFPDADPGRAFDSLHCVRAVLRAERQQWEIPRGAFWDALIKIAVAAGPRYAGYSYKQRADRFELPLTKSQAEEIRAASPRLSYSTLRRQIAAAHLVSVDLYAER
jgi:hypothetical protein